MGTVFSAASITLGYILTVIHEQRSGVHTGTAMTSLILHDSRSAGECRVQGDPPKNAVPLVTVDKKRGVSCLPVPCPLSAASIVDPHKIPEASAEVVVGKFILELKFTASNEARADGRG